MVAIAQRSAKALMSRRQIVHVHIGEHIYGVDIKKPHNNPLDGRKLPYYGFPPTEEKTIKVENIDRHVYATPLKCPETITSIKSCCHVTRYT